MTDDPRIVSLDEWLAEKVRTEQPFAVACPVCGKQTEVRPWSAVFQSCVYCNSTFIVASRRP